MLTSPQRRVTLKEMDYEKRKQEREIIAGGNQARALQNKLRAGELTQKKLELLSYVGYEPARQLKQVDSPDDVVKWAKGLYNYGTWCSQIAATITAELTLPIYESYGLHNQTARKVVKYLQLVRENPLYLDSAELAEITASIRNGIRYSGTLSSAAYAIANAARLVSYPDVYYYNATFFWAISAGVDGEQLRNQTKDAIVREILK